MVGKKIRQRILAAISVTAIVVTLGACSGGDDIDNRIILLTHDSFSISKSLLSEFENDSGMKVVIHQLGDANTLANRLILTKDAPLGDVVFGIDNVSATKVLDESVITPYVPDAEGKKDSDTYSVDQENRLHAVDYSDVCVNIDHEYFSKKNLAEPKTLEDLKKPEYSGLLVVENPATSSPGMAFLLATVAAFGEDGYVDYWKDLKNNKVKVADDWTSAYTVDFSGSSGKGPRPLVVSYSSSPPSEVPSGATEAPTSALLDTCYRQVEYTGVLVGARNYAGAKKLVDFLLSRPFQEDIPDQMYMYPVDSAASIPDMWNKFAPTATKPYTLSSENINKNSKTWVTKWTETVIG